MDKKINLVLDTSILTEKNEFTGRFIPEKFFWDLREPIAWLNQYFSIQVTQIIFLIEKEVYFNGNLSFSNIANWKIETPKYVLVNSKNNGEVEKILDIPSVFFLNYFGVLLYSFNERFSNKEVFLISQGALKKRKIIKEGLQNYVPLYKIELHKYWDFIKSIFSQKNEMEGSDSIDVPEPLQSFYTKETFQHLHSIKKFKSGVFYLYSENDFFREYAAQFLFSKNTSKYTIDLVDGFPFFSEIIKESEIIYFKNINTFSYQRQIFLWHSIIKHALLNKFIIFEGESIETIAKTILSEIEYIPIQLRSEVQNIKVKILISMILQELGPEHFYDVDNKKLSLMNISIKMLLEIKDDLRMVYELLKEKDYFINPDDLINLSPWVELLEDYQKYITIKDIKIKKTENKYYMLFCGDYWEISFGYKKPILIENSEGLAYIAYMMNNEGKDFEAEDLRKKISGPEKAAPASDEKNVPAIRKVIKTAIKNIKQLESLMEYGNEFSDFLVKSFFPNTIVGYLENAKITDPFFRDTQDKCMCRFPKDSKIDWEFISTPLYKKIV